MKTHTKTKLPIWARIIVSIGFLAFLMVITGVIIFFKQDYDIKNRIDLIRQEQAADVTIPSAYLEQARENVKNNVENNEIKFIAEETVSENTVFNIAFDDAKASGHIYYMGTDNNYESAIGANKTYMLCEYTISDPNIWLPNLTYVTEYGEDGVKQETTYKYRINGQGDWLSETDAGAYKAQKGDVVEVLAYMNAITSKYTFEWLSPDNTQAVSVTMLAPLQTDVTSEGSTNET